LVGRGRSLELWLPLFRSPCQVEKPWLGAGYAAQPVEPVEPALLAKARHGIVNKARAKHVNGAAGGGGDEDKSHPPLCTITEKGIAANYKHLQAAPSWEDVVNIPPAAAAATAVQIPIVFGDRPPLIAPLMQAPLALVAIPDRENDEGAGHDLDNPFMNYKTQIKKRRGKKTDADGRKWSVKNSFLHLQSSESETENDSFDGGSSQRSSSAPSKMRSRGAEEEAEERTLPHPSILEQYAAHGILGVPSFLTRNPAEPAEHPAEYQA